MINRTAVRTVSSGLLHCARTVTALVALAVGNLGAQDSTVLERAHWMVGGSLGVVGSPRERVRAELTLIGMHFTQLKSGRLGADISINVMPRLLADGVLGGAAVLGAGRFGLRTGLTWHQFKDDGSVWLLEVGIVKLLVGK